MSTTQNSFSTQGANISDLKAYLPSEEELASLASEYFSEFDNEAKLHNSATSALDIPNLDNIILQSIQYVDQNLLDVNHYFNAVDVNSYYNGIIDELFTQEIRGYNSSVNKEESEILSYVKPSFFDVDAIRKDFPILSEKINGKNLIWLDNAATTQKPKSVIDRISYFYEHENSNIHRAAHGLAARATDAYEAARDTVAKFINAPDASNIVFARGTTEAINLIAHSWGKQNISEGDEIIISWLEHHANIVPWQLLASEIGAKIKVIPIDDSGQIILSELERLITPKTKIISIAQVSNSLGTVTPIEEIIQIAHRRGVRVLVDGAQGISHLKVDVQALDADFYVFSGHKVFAPTGIGAIYAKKEILENEMQPYQGGGNMIADVTHERTIFQPPPNKFEAGTGNIADAVGLGAALDYVSSIGIERINKYEHYLLEYGTETLLGVSGLKIIGTATNKTSVLSFVIDGFDTKDIGTILANEGIAVRAGHHCAQPAIRRFGLETTVRPSVAFYNTTAELDFLVSILKDIKKRSNSGYTTTFIQL